MLVEQGSGIGQSEWARAGIPASAADAGASDDCVATQAVCHARQACAEQRLNAAPLSAAGGPQHSSPVIVLQLAPASGQATPAASIPLNAAQHTTSNTIIVPTPGNSCFPPLQTCVPNRPCLTLLRVAWHACSCSSRMQSVLSYKP